MVRSCLILIIVFAIGAAAQNGVPDISGTIRDQAGAVVPNAEVRLITSQQLVLAATRSDQQGRYSLVGISDGTYVITASHDSFGTQDRTVTLGRQRPLAFDITLSVNPFSEEVTVTADAGLAEERSSIPYQINVVPGDAISQRTTNVMAQVADEETGVSLQKTSPTIGAVLVRGLTEVGVYVDGIRYTNSTQRGGINTFFNLNEPTTTRSVEIQRSPNTAQFGSDGLGGNVQLLSRQPEYGFEKPRWNGELNTAFTSSDRSFGGNALVGYGSKNYGILGNIFGRRINDLRPGGGRDSHSAITRFLGLPSDIIGSERLPNTGFTQYGANLQANLVVEEKNFLSFRYQRSQQDDGARYDQLLGGDGNLIAELKNLMLDFGYLRYYRQGLGFFDNFSTNISYNSQREERINQGGQGNPLAAITNDRERTTSWGFGFFLDKQFTRNNFLLGGDHYHDKVTAPSFRTEPSTGAVTLVRPRVPNGSTYDLSGIYVQDVFNAVPDRLRISGALRYNIGQYRSRAADAPLVGGQPLFPDDSARFTDLSGRLGATVRIVGPFSAAVNFSRGFRAPNITSLGGLGLVGVGFQVSTTDVIDLGATIGTTADANAVSTGVKVAPLRSEISNNIDLGLRYSGKRFRADLTAYFIDYGDTIVRQTLILPQGAVGLALGSQNIIAQDPSGAVYVPVSTSPVLVQANYGDSRIKGAEFDLEYRLSSSWTTAGNYSYVYAEDRETGAAPNLGGGGIPPQLAFLRVRYQPASRPYWIEAYINGAGRQSRLSTLDLSDRRTGGSRTRSQIQNFFRRGACVRGITTVGSNGQCGSSGGTLVTTGETLAQVQDRVLPIGSVINGVLVTSNSTSVPLFNSIPGYVLFNVRGGYRFSEDHHVFVDLENIGDKGNRLPGWGIDGPGRSLTLRYQYRF